MFWLRNKKNNFQLRTLIWGPVTPPPQKKTKTGFSCDEAHIEANPEGMFSCDEAQLLDSLIVSSFVCNSLILYVPVNKFSGMSGWFFLY